MEIWHSGNIAPEHKAFLEANSIMHKPFFSVKHPQNIQSYIYEIFESNPAWPELKKRLWPDHVHHWVRTKFTGQELRDAEWCIVWGIHSIGSLQYEGYGFHREYYADGCRSCGTGWRQTKPFRLKREPKIGKNQFCSFGGADELFATLSVLQEFDRLEIRGFETMPLLLNSGVPVQSIKQIKTNNVADPGIAEDRVEHERYRQFDCLACGRTWHTYYVRGMLPLRRDALNRDVDFQLTNEWFGSGRNARREILVSSRVVRLVLEKKWRGVSLVPIQVV